MLTDSSWMVGGVGVTRLFPCTSNDLLLLEDGRRLRVAEHQNQPPLPDH